MLPFKMFTPFLRDAQAAGEKLYFGAPNKTRTLAVLTALCSSLADFFREGLLRARVRWGLNALRGPGISSNIRTPPSDV